MTKKILIISSILWCILLLSIEISLPFILINHIKNSEHGLSVDEKCAIIVGFIFIIILSIAFFYFINLSLLTQESVNKINFYTLTTVTMNIFAIVIIAKYCKNQSEFQKNFKGFSTFELIISGLIVALFFALNWINSLFPQLPFFMTLTIQWLPLFFFAYMASFLQCLITFFICGIINFFMPNNYDTYFVAYMFDYLFPITGISIAALLKPYNIKEEKSITKKMTQWCAFIAIPLLISYFSKVLAGVLYWFDSGWGWSKWTYSFVFNFFCFTSDMIFFSLTVPIMCTTISFIKEKYYKN